MMILIIMVSCFVTTDDMTVAKKEAIDKFPALVLFRNGIPMAYKGNVYLCVNVFVLACLLTSSR